MRRRLFGVLNGSELDYVIPPEIKNDALYREIIRVASTPGLSHILEIGSSSGDGSTEAFVSGIRQNAETPKLHCLEIASARFVALKKRYASTPFVQCYNLSSVPLERFSSAEEVERFRREIATSHFSRIPAKEVRRWLDQDRKYLLAHGLSSNGIQQIKLSNGIDRFDVVLIDGSEFTAAAELDEIYGATFILLDDICSFKNYANYHRLRADPQYRLVTASEDLRNGFASFERVS